MLGVFLVEQKCGWLPVVLLAEIEIHVHLSEVVQFETILRRRIWWEKRRVSSYGCRGMWEPTENSSLSAQISLLVPSVQSALNKQKNSLLDTVMVIFMLKRTQHTCCNVCTCGINKISTNRSFHSVSHLI